MSNNESLEININNEININASINAEINPIVIQLQEFGYNNIYSRRVFHYLHPENLDEALNYMSEERGIIQHRFIQDRNTSNKICYICGEAQEKHLNELNINNNNNDINEDINIEIQNEVNEINQSGIRNNSIGSNNHTINMIVNNIEKINENENNKNEINKKELDELSEDINDINFKMFPFKYGLNRNKKNIINRVKNYSENTTLEEIKTIEEKIECIICNEMFIVNEKNKNEKCGHAFCNSCWYDFLSVKIKDNKLSSIKCLDYNCKEKLSDEFIINLLNSDINLLNKYNRYKFELEIINDPNKKLCPYPNCGSYLELKQIRQRDVTCKNNHKFCFICLKNPHGKLPCDENIDKSILEYAKNNFVKKCPKCGIVIEKNNGCNHITCTQCKYQWYWLCNDKYETDHFTKGKCKGFQFFKPKNDYEIKLKKKKKINSKDLNDSQRQFDPFEPERGHRHHHRVLRHLRRRNLVLEDNFRPRRHREILRIDNYFMFSFRNKINFISFYIFFGNPFCFLDNRMSELIFFPNVIICCLYYITYFFWMIFLNIISIILIIVFVGLQNFITEEIGKYYNKLRLIFVHSFLYAYINSFIQWKNIINESNIHSKKIVKIILFFPCLFMTVIIYFPKIIIFNACILIIIYFSKCFNFFLFFDDKIHKAFSFRIYFF